MVLMKRCATLGSSHDYDRSNDVMKVPYWAIFLIIAVITSGVWVPYVAQVVLYGFVCVVHSSDWWPGLCSDGSEGK